MDGSVCIPLELLEENRCDTELVICSGPYASSAEADAVCGGTPCGGTATFRCDNPAGCANSDDGWTLISNDCSEFCNTTPPEAPAPYLAEVTTNCGA
jgi:hypothetical protein